MKNSVLVSILAIASTCAAQFDPEQCGPKAGNQRCKQNKCCSQYGWCGTSNAYCLANLGCQAGFGRCTGVVSSSRASSSSVRSSTVAASPSAPAALVSTNGRCGSSFGGQICKGSTFGDCCSQYNWCGTSTDHCRASQGCQLGFGTCTGVQSSSISVSLSRTSSSRSSASSVSSTRSQGTSSVSSRGSSSSTRSSSSSSRASSASSILASSTTFSTRTSLSSSSSGSSSISASQSSQSSSSSPIATSSSASQASSTSIPLSSSSSSAQPSVSSSSAQPSASSSSSSIAPSSSSSSGVSSSSSAIVSSSSALISSSSIISSSTAAPSSSSSLIQSSTTSSASPSLSLISSTSSLAASSSASGSPTVVTHILRAAQNPSVDRTSLEHLVPKNALNFYFAEDGTSYTTSVQTTLDSGALGVLLENIASLSSVTCSGSAVNLQFSDEASYNAARNWPEGTILFTLSEGCNTATERGVYRLRTTTTSTTPLPRLRARQTNYWALPLDVLLIQMVAVVSDYENLKAAAAAEEAANPKPTPPMISFPPEFTSTALPDVTSTVSVVAVSSSTAAQPSASPSGLPACGGYAPGGRFDIDGTTYQISCTLAGTWRAIWIDISWQETFRACMAYCNLNTNCVVATYNEQQINNGKYMCQRWSLLPYKTDNAVNAPMAVKVV